MTTATPTPTLSPERIARAAQFIRHRLTCPGGELRPEIGSLGDLIVRCSACARFAFPGRAARTTPATADWTPKPTPAPVVAVAAVQRSARYFCPVHLRVVTWRGTGCGACDTERAEARERRALRRDNARKAAAGRRP